MGMDIVLCPEIEDDCAKKPLEPGNPNEQLTGGDSPSKTDLSYYKVIPYVDKLDFVLAADRFPAII